MPPTASVDNVTTEAVRLPARLLLPFAFPCVLIGTLTTALTVVLPAFYAKYTRATLTGIGTAMLIARLVEVGTDASIGYLTDVTRSRFGPRKPWLAAGAVLAPIATVFLFTPAFADGNLYFSIWVVGVFFTWTLTNIPYRAWAVELSRDYDERARIFGWLGIAQGIGALLFAAAPFLPVAGLEDLGAQGIATIGWALGLSLPLVVALALAVVPQGTVLKSDAPSLAKLFEALRGNRLLWRFLAAYIVGGTAQTIVLACFYFYVDAHLGLGSRFPLALVVAYLGGLAGIPLWLALIRRIGKHRAWAIGWGSLAFIGGALALITPGPAGLVPLLVTIGVYGMASSIDLVAPLALLGDIVDYDHWKTRVNRAGSYNALAILLQKANIAIGAAIAYFALDWTGFDVRVAEHSSGSTAAFVVIFAGVPALFFLASAAIIWRFPLDRGRHEIVRRRLAQRAIAQR